MTLSEFRKRSDAEFIAQLLVKHDGCVISAASEAGIHRSTLYALMKCHGIETQHTRGRGNAEWRAMQ